MPDWAFTIVLFAILIGITIPMQKKYNKEKKKQKNPEELYSELRTMAFEATPGRLELEDYTSNLPFGVIMELGATNGTVTVVAYIDGNASLYFNPGPIMIGGYAHPQISNAAIEFVRTSGDFTENAKQVRDFPPPEAGHVTFHILTDSGIAFISGKESDLQDKTVDHWPLYYRGQDLITEYRLKESGS